MEYWNYRIMRQKNQDDEYEYGIYEVYYDSKDKMYAHTELSLTPTCTSVDDLREELNIMLRAFELETLEHSEKSLMVQDIYSLLEKMKVRPGMYLGNSKISSMDNFLNGFNFAEMITGKRLKKEFPPFWYFHEWVMDKYKYNESTAGWKNIILTENENNEEKALQIFFDMIEEFKTLYPKKILKAKLNPKNIEFHNSDKCKSKRMNGDPVYINPEHVLLVEFSHNFGYYYYVIKDNQSINFHYDRFKTENDANTKINSLFGEVEWIEIDGDLKKIILDCTR